MSGIRDSKTVDGVEYNYLTLDGKVVRQTWGSNVLDIIYDNSGLPYALKYNGAYYIYVLNQQGDVIRIVNSTGATVAEYRYDAWGNVIYSSGSMSAINPIRYRGYYYDTETGFYYLQSRYYDPGTGRFINADSKAATGQSFIGYNMLAYCRNNPTSRVDSKGTEDDDINAEMDRLLNEYATIDEIGFTIDLESATVEWNSCISEMGVKEAYEYMSDYLCQKYKEKYEKKFPFSNSCVAYEIEHHVDAYMSVKGNSGYSRNITTYFMSDEYIIEHCKVVNISTNDVGNFKQEKMFGYKNGIRECYKNTPDDPYREDRKPFWKRILWW